MVFLFQAVKINFGMFKGLHDFRFHVDDVQQFFSIDGVGFRYLGRFWSVQV